STSLQKVERAAGSWQSKVTWIWRLIAPMVARARGRHGHRPAPPPGRPSVPGGGEHAHPGVAQRPHGRAQDLLLDGGRRPAGDDAGTVVEPELDDAVPATQGDVPGGVVVPQRPWLPAGEAVGDGEPADRRGDAAGAAAHAQLLTPLVAGGR